MRKRRITSSPGQDRLGLFIANMAICRTIQAAFLEFLAASAETPIVAANTFEGIDRPHHLQLLLCRRAGQPLLVLSVCGTESVPPGQFFDGVAEQRVLAILHNRQSTVVLDRVFQVSLEVLKSKPAAVDGATLKGPFDQGLQLAEAEHGDGALPAIPDEAVMLITIAHAHDKHVA